MELPSLPETLEVKYNAKQMMEYAFVAVLSERKRIRDELWDRHKKNQMSHNFYYRLVLEMDDGVL